MSSTRALAICCLVWLVGGVLGGCPGARADDCDLASTAAIAQAKVPHAITHVMIAPGQSPVRAEMILTATTAYSQIDGAWHAVPFSAQQQIDMITAATQRTQQTPHTCQKVGNQQINGEAASLLIMRTEANGKVTEARMWISDRTSLPLRSEIHLDNGTVVTDDFRYDNIAPPPDVK
jgi:hypothetical protein